MNGDKIRGHSVYFAAAGAVLPWRLYVGDVHGRVAEVGGVAATESSDSLTVHSTHRHQQEDARIARWSGSAEARVHLQADSTVDLRREANGEMALAFDLMVLQPPSGPVTLRMDCGPSCSGALDLTDTLAGQPEGEWRTVRVRLSCFATAGADLAQINTPFLIATADPLTLGFAEVRLVSASDGEATCPPAVGRSGG